MAGQKLLASSDRLAVLPARVLKEVLSAVCDAQAGLHPRFLGSVTVDTDVYELTVDGTASVLAVHCVRGGQSEFRASESVRRLQDRISTERLKTKTTPIAKAANEAEPKLARKQREVREQALRDIEPIQRLLDKAIKRRDSIREAPAFDAVYDLHAFRDCAGLSLIPLNQDPCTYLAIGGPKPKAEDTAPDSGKIEGQEAAGPLEPTSTKPTTEDAASGTSQPEKPNGSSSSDESGSTGSLPSKTAPQKDTAPKARATSRKGRQSKRRTSKRRTTSTRSTKGKGDT